MPNGGYPMQSLTPIAGTDLAIHVRATHVSLWQQVPSREDTDRRPTFVSVAELTTDQAGALAYHLLYWSGAANHEVLTGLRGGRLPIRPRFHSAGCRYDY